MIKLYSRVIIKSINLTHSFLNFFAVSSQPFHNNHQILKYLEPFSICLAPSEKLPFLKIKSQKYLMENWWSQKPFQLQPNQPMVLPVFDFYSSKFSGQTIQVPQEIFNNPLRRDLIYRLYNFRRNLDKIRTKVTRNRAMTAGSGMKMRQQKGSGRARMGDKRAPHLHKGGKVHGQKAKVYSFPLNVKVKLQALKALLSSKMAEGKIRIVNNQQIDDKKTKIMRNITSSLIQDQRAIFCIITSSQADNNFILSQRSLKNVIWHTPYNLDVLSLFKADRIIITLDGLKQLIESIYKTVYVSYRQKHQKTIEQIMDENNPKQQQQEHYDPQKPYEFKFKILAQYLDLYKQLKQKSPDLLEIESKRIRKIL